MRFITLLAFVASLTLAGAVAGQAFDEHPSHLPAFAPSYAVAGNARRQQQSPLLWELRQVAKASALEASTAAQVKTVKLPTSLPIGALIIRFRTTAAITAGTITVNSIRVVGDGGVTLWDSTGLQARAIYKHLQGSLPAGGAGASSTAPTYGLILQFGRFARDPEVMIPAGFSQLELQIDVTTSQSSANQCIDVAAEVYLGANPIKATKRTLRVATEAISDAEVMVKDLPRGGMLTDVYLHATAEANVTGSEIRVNLDDGKLFPFVMMATALEMSNIARGRFDDATLPVVTGSEKLYRIDLDPLDTLQGLDARGYEKVQIETTAAASGTSGNIEVLVTQVI